MVEADPPHVIQANQNELPNVRSQLLSSINRLSVVVLNGILATLNILPNRVQLHRLPIMRRRQFMAVIQNVTPVERNVFAKKHLNKSKFQFLVVPSNIPNNRNDEVKQNRRRHTFQFIVRSVALNGILLIRNDFQKVDLYRPHR